MGAETQMKNDEDLARFLGRRLRDIRQAQGLRQQDLQELGINQKYYQRIEAGRVNLTLRSLEKLASALGIEILDVFQKPPLKKGTSAKSRRKRS
jgi:transcriptional regulator with XRE-family HTH domain